MSIHISRLVMSNSCDPMDYNPQDSSVHGILQARILEWVIISFSRESSQPRDQTWVAHISGGFFTIWATREVIGCRENEMRLLTKVLVSASP